MIDSEDTLTLDIEISILQRNVNDLESQLNVANKRIKELTDALHDAGTYAPSFDLAHDTD